MLEIPSEVHDRKYIRMPKQDKVVESDEEWSRCGKWILTNRSGTLPWVDETWIKLQVLLEKGCLLMIKSSTAAANDTVDNGTILCFTKPGEKEIERAAKEIRDAVHYEHPLYYKTNDQTEDNINYRYGYKRIPKYMHTIKGFFYKIGHIGWILISGSDSGETEKALLRRNSMVFDINNFKDIGFVQLPSKSRREFLIMENNNLYQKKTPTFLNIRCNWKSERNIICEADRLWIVGKKLIREGAVNQITCVKSADSAIFRFYVLQELKVEASTELCEKIYFLSQVFEFFYISIGELLYRYSPEKEMLPYVNNY